MNANHARLCQSAEWAEVLQSEILAPLLGSVDLGEEMLEVGPGPGAATEWLITRVRRLRALELDAAAARALSSRLPGVEVMVADAACSGLGDETFDSVGCFTMLHHVPTLVAQGRVLAEMYRVLRPGGVLALSDSLASDELHGFHELDSYNPMDPGILLTLLRALGLERITLNIGDGIGLVGRKPPAGQRPRNRGDRCAPE